MDEIWKDVVGYEGYYQISNKGRVKSLPRKYSRSEKIRALAKSKHGGRNDAYYSVNLSMNSKCQTNFVHRMVAVAFLGHKPDGHNSSVDHIDGNPLNNNLENLQIISHRANIAKGKRVGGSSKYVGVSRSSKSHTEIKWVARIYVNGVNEFLGGFKTEKEASKAYQKRLKSLE